MPDNYPSNSIVPKENKPTTQQTAKKPPDKIIKGTAKTRKPSLGKRMFSDIFLWGDISEVLENLYENVLVPKFKDILSSTVLGIIYRNNPGKPQSNSPNSTVYTNYSSYRDSQRRQAPAPSIRNLVDDIVLTSEDDARHVLRSMDAQINEFGVVTVGYMYALLGFESDHTKENYGWYNLSDATFIRVDGGFMLRLPKPVLLSR